VLVELGLVEQRYQAVSEVLAGVSVTEVAGRFGVTRQSVHRWLRRYAAQGLAGLVDGSTVPGSCPHQMPPAVEARIVELRREYPGWGPRTIGHRLEREGVTPLPGRSSIYRCLVLELSENAGYETAIRARVLCWRSTDGHPRDRQIWVLSLPRAR
jgi:transposase